MSESTPILPNRKDCEEELIARILEDPTAISQAIDLGLRWSDLFLEAYRKAFRAAESLYKRGELIHDLSLKDELRRLDIYDEELWARIRELDRTGVSAIEYVVREIKMTAVLRGTYNEMVQLTQQVEAGEIDDSITLATRILAISDRSIERSTATTSLFRT